MKLIAVVIAVAVVILVVVSYELLLKLAEKKNEDVPNEIEEAFDSYQKQKSKMEQVKKKIINKTKTK